ncbi:hypothetical protein BO94DRAFT_27455 [Aspergillus sclerotioniger CBS 115572]|uniref:Uncharacterized protein n=1 Tax=Aspergillus sclerotioniger CBS 115572 TaxID=1450535 RepID=A0A317WVT0_9EURO|nr:hypothetical protein BO94DRAFT_27455 [Aspergillus sclerotioniger CBS 115572]PWY90514.1 hypothetical protein BO94DRAFT_27455 [Aspergillus sclerotioniger CBS 115572]
MADGCILVIVVPLLIPSVVLSNSSACHALIDGPKKVKFLQAETNVIPFSVTGTRTKTEGVTQSYGPFLHLPGTDWLIYSIENERQYCPVIRYIYGES